MIMGLGMLGMMVMMVLFWLLVVGLAVWLLSRLFPAVSQDRDSHSTHRNRNETAMDIVVQRYARGEITKTEYDEIRRLLTKPTGE